MTQRKLASSIGLLIVLTGGLLTDTVAQDINAPPDSLTISDTGQVGMGTATPQRQLHVKGANASLRLDRSTDAASFMMVRTDDQGNVLKTFSVGTRASGPNVGEFQIADFGQATGGASARRLTITNDGTAIFTGTVRAPAFVQTSSERFKQDIATLTAVGPALAQMRGVRFVWKDTGRPALGVIAEEVAAVFPEAVEREGADGPVTAVNYSALVAVLVEAVKAQQTEITALKSQQTVSKAQQKAQQEEIAALKVQAAAFDTVQARLAALEAQLNQTVPVVLTQR